MTKRGKVLRDTSAGPGYSLSMVTNISSHSKEYGSPLSCQNPGCKSSWNLRRT
jgi:hypothetical protein